ncbi:calcium-activated chloride channel regulator 3A-1-like [Asterias amurensis]|uniref:calcium-activated chloride channel regulator 3A-1-like n=1 Tax=Asterias amurensis TaxID=7602 RepID=UPI003AB1F026
MAMLRLLLVSVLVLMFAGFSRIVTGYRNTRAPLELVNKGYVNLLIGINERVPEDPALLDRIKFVFTETSQFLYQATNQKAYFKDIHILVPETWSNSDAYSHVDWQRYDQSDVMIDLPSDGGSNRPYTNKPTQCGEPGFSINLTPDYILSQSIAGRYGDYDKALVHEWAHYRWGVFDEFPLESGRHFYANEDGSIEAVRCVRSITGNMVNPKNGFRACEIMENGLPEPDCRFLDNTNDVTSSGYTGSLMYKQFLPQISTFCEKSGIGSYEGNKHNRDAPNLQNNRCQGKSIWEVMMEHEDFRISGKGDNSVNGGGETSGTEAGGYNPPTFTIVKRTSSRIVLVLDRSGSMKDQRLIQLRQAAEILITQILRDGEQLGIVTFDNRAVVNSELLVINDANRQTLLSLLPTFADGATSIGAGVQVGLEVLGRNGPAAGGKLLVITDGEENRAPFIEDILHLVNESGVTIDTIAIGLDASPELERLSNSTGGQAYNHDERSNSLADAFSKSATTEKSITSVPVSLYMDFVQVQAGTKFTDAVYIDSTLGKNTQFIFGHVSRESISVVVTDPDGVMISDGSPGYNSNIDFLQIRVTIPGDAKIGLWTFQIENKLQNEENVTILVQSHAREGGDPIVVNARWGLESVVPPQRQSLYVSVGKGNIPVIRSDVRAVIDRPCSNATVTLIPKDDGIGADVRMDDGVYSTYFTDFCGEGRYGANIDVSNNGDVTSIVFGSVIGSGAASDPAFDDVDGESIPELLGTGNFQRVTVGGSFKCESADLCNATVDRYPPSRITDLRADNVDIENMQITLTFTAPGDDLTNGQVSSYIIKRTLHSSDLFDNFEAAEEIPSSSYVTGDVSVTSMAGESEVFVLSVSKTGSFSYYFSVVAVDDEGNQSEPSNVASSSARNFRKFPLALVVGISVGGALLLIILIALAAVLCRKRQPKEAEGDVSGKMGSTERNMNHYSTAHEEENQNGSWAGNTAQAAKPTGVVKTAMVPTKGVKVANPKGAAKSAGVAYLAGPDNGAGAFGTAPTDDPVYDHVISRRDRDPNWDPNLANNREGGGAHIKPGHVRNALSMFDNQGFRPDSQ